MPPRHDWTIPMGSQVSVEAERRKHGADAVGECPCERDGFPHPSRVTPTGPDHITGVQPCCGDPGDCDCSEPPHVGHFSRLGGTWWCDTCNSPYCELA